MIPRLILHALIAAAGGYALIDPPPSIVAAANPSVALTWSLLLIVGGVLSVYAVASNYVLPHVAGLGCEVLGIVVYCVAIWIVAERQAVTAVLLLAAFAIGLIERGLRVRREAMRHG